MRNFRLLLPLALFSAILLFSCKNDIPATYGSGEVTTENEFNANASTMSGNWINKSFLDRINSSASVVQATNNSHQPFMLAFTVLPEFPDSIILFSGDTAIVRAALYNVDTVQIQNVKGTQPIYAVFDSNGDKEVTVFDYTSGEVTLDKYVLSRGPEKFPSAAFDRAINHHLLNGEYILPQGKNAQQVLFLADGTVGGLDGYIKYKICIKGDCFKTGPGNDVIMLMKKTGEIDYFAMELSIDRKSLKLYDLTPSDASGTRVWNVGKLRFGMGRP